MKHKNPLFISLIWQNTNRRTFNQLLLILFTLLCLAGCKEEELNELDFVSAVTVDTEVVGLDAVRLFGSINGIEGSINPSEYPNREFGFLWTSSMEVEPLLGAGGVERISLGQDISNRDFNETLSNLSIQEIYFFRAFVQIGERVSYGNVLPFSLSDNLAVGLSDSVTVVNRQAELRGVLVLKFQEDISDHGLVLSFSNSEPTVEDNDIIFSLGPTNDDGQFSALVDSLEFNSCYYVRAFAQVGQEYVYNDGPAVSFRVRDGWQQVALLDNKPALDPMGGVVGETAYFGMGCNEPPCFPVQTQTFTEVWSLDLSADTLLNTNLPGASGRLGGVSFTVENKIYYGLGFYNDPDSPINFPIYINDLWAYSPSTGWEEMTDDPFPGTPRQDAVAVVLDGKAYVGTGYDAFEDAFYDDFWVFDPTADSGSRWAPLDIPLPFRDEASGEDFAGGRTEALAFVHGGRIYAGTGQLLGFDRNDLWSIDPDTDSEWRWEASEDFLKRRNAVAFSINDNTYIGLGENGANNKFRSLWQLSSDGSWEEKGSFPLPVILQDRTIPQVAVSLNGKAYIAGPNLDYISFDVWEYTPFDEGLECQ